MATFVLVHGVHARRLVLAAGRPAAAGRRPRGLCPDADRPRRARPPRPPRDRPRHPHPDVVNVLVYENLRDVVLVGQSYGSLVVTGVADRAPERVAQLV